MPIIKRSAILENQNKECRSGPGYDSGYSNAGRWSAIVSDYKRCQVSTMAFSAVKNSEADVIVENHNR